jgi:hypothetical protein
MPKLLELNLTANPIVKKPSYRQSILKRISLLKILDGKEVTQEERE